MASTGKHVHGAAEMRRTFILFTVCFAWMLSGCEQSALMSMRRQNLQAEQRIATKQAELEQLQYQQRVLQEDKERLLSELDSQQMTLDQLSTRLDQLQRQNARIKADTAQQVKTQQKLNARIQQYQQEIDALQRNDQISLQEKQQRIKELKQKIKTYLKLGLGSE